jgi:tetratricopeptide (TPR) repeat protein
MRTHRVFLWGIVLIFLLPACSTFVNYHAKGLQLLEAGRRPEAWEAFEKGYRNDPLSPFSLNNMGYVLEMRDERLFEAANFYRRAIAACQEHQEEPDVARLEKKAHENLGRVLWKIQNMSRWHVNVPDLRSPFPKS